MSTGPQNQTRLEELVSQLLDGNLPEENQDELRELLRNNDSAREKYLEQVVTHAMLQWRQGAGVKAESAASEATPAGAAPIAPTGANTSNPLAPDQAAPSGLTGYLGMNFPRFALFTLLVVFAVSLGLAYHANLFGPLAGNPNLAGAKSGSSVDPRQLRVARLTTTINSRWNEE